MFAGCYATRNAINYFARDSPNAVILYAGTLPLHHHLCTSQDIPSYLFKTFTKIFPF